MKINTQFKYLRLVRIYMPLWVPLITIIFFSGCGLAQPTELIESRSVDSIEEIAISDHFYGLFEGSIDSKYDIVMNLSRHGDEISGNYYYKKHGAPLFLKGTVDQSNGIQIEERDQNHEPTGIFNGKFTSKEEIVGTWTNGKTQQILPFHLRAVKDSGAGITYKVHKNENCTTKDKLERGEFEIEDYSYGLHTECSYIEIMLFRIELNNKEIATQINTAIEKRITNYWDNTETTDYSRSKTIEEYLASLDNLEIGEFYSSEYYHEIIHNDDDILSYRLDVQVRSAGSRMNYYTTNCNYDLKTGKLLYLSDFVVPDGLDDLKRVAWEIFIKKYADDSHWAHDLESFQLNENFLYTKGGLIFNFGHYELGPYSFGQPDIYIPFEQIKKILTK